MENCWRTNCHTYWEKKKYNWSTKTVKYASTKTTACNYNKANDAFMPTWCPSIGRLPFFVIVQSQSYNTSCNYWIPSLKQWKTKISEKDKCRSKNRKGKKKRLRPWRTNVPTDRIWERLCTLNMPAKTAATMPHQIWEWRGVWRVGCILEKNEGNRPSLPSPRYNLDCLVENIIRDTLFSMRTSDWIKDTTKKIQVHIYIFTWT